MNRAGGENLWAAAGRFCTILTERANRFHKGLQRRRSVRRLRLSEILSLGEKRFVAVVQFQQQEFLVGGTGNSIALLAKLDAPDLTQNLRDGFEQDGF